MVHEDTDEMARPSCVVQVIETGHSLATHDNALSKYSQLAKKNRKGTTFRKEDTSASVA
jgi:hypothetical protein